MKSYRKISSVVMADNENIEAVYYEPLPSLKEISYDDGSIEKDDLLTTKPDVLEEAAYIVVSGYGTFAGRKVWQLPQKIKAQIISTMIESLLV